MRAGWESKTLKDICIVDWGNTDLTKSAYTEAGEFLAVSAAGCDGRIGHKEHSKFTPVLSAIGAQCGRMFLPDEDFTAIKNTITLTPREGFCTGEFLYQLLTHVDLPKRGAAQPFISKGDIQSFRVMIPVSLSEQQRIVAILKEAFDSIATARVNTEKNLQNARALFESHLQSVFTLCGEVGERRLGDVFMTATGNTPPKGNAEYYGDFMPLVKPPELRDDWIYEAEDGLSELGARVARSLPPNSVLVSCIGNLGKVGINAVPVAFNQQINAILPDTEVAFPEFMFFQALSSGFKSQLEEMASGTTVPIVNKSKFNDVRIALAPLKDQIEIIDSIRSVRNETQRLESLYQRKLDALDDLKKSLLHQAFSGEL